MLSLIYFLVILGVLVLVHEFGHFLMAKRLGVRVEKFSLGFGPKIFSVKKNETEYIISAIPLGGYVKMAGDEPGEKVTGAKWEFFSRKPFDRFRIIFAGPLLNYLFAFLIFSFIFTFGRPTTEIGALLKDYPAEKSGLRPGDRVTAIDDKKVKFWEEMTELIYKHVEGPMKITIEREGKILNISLHPVVRETKDIFGHTAKIALIGIAPSQKLEKTKNNFFASVELGFRKLISLTVLTYKALWYMIIGRLSFKESMMGPLGIFVTTGQVARMGLIPLLNFMGVLSASLAIFNVLPFPVLDGGHIIFLLLEKLRGKPLSVKTQEMISNIGITLLIMFTVFVFYNDIVRFGLVKKIMRLFG